LHRPPICWINCAPQGRLRRRALSKAAHPGTPFLEGATVMVPGANLLQRVAAAVGDVGGLVQSSQVDVSGAQTKDGFVGLVVSCELEQPGLQCLSINSMCAKVARSPRSKTSHTMCC
jgi:hypothetical protein